MNKTTHTQTARVAAGVWGGAHIRMEMHEAGARIEYDCAHGTLDEPLTLDNEGHFDARGTHTREAPGPIRLKALPVPQPARFRGRISGETITLTVTLEDSGAEVGTFTLTHGINGRVFKCR